MSTELHVHVYRAYKFHVDLRRCCIASHQTYGEVQPGAQPYCRRSGLT